MDSFKYISFHLAVNTLRLLHYSLNWAERYFIQCSIDDPLPQVQHIDKI